MHGIDAICFVWPRAGAELSDIAIALEAKGIRTAMEDGQLRASLPVGSLKEFKQVSDAIYSTAGVSALQYPAETQEAYVRLARMERE